MPQVRSKNYSRQKRKPMKKYANLKEQLNFSTTKSCNYPVEVERNYSNENYKKKMAAIFHSRHIFLRAAHSVETY